MIASSLMLMLSVAVAVAPAPAPTALRFADVTAAAGLVMTTTCGGPGKQSILESTGSGAAFLDFDGDGRLDLFVANGSTTERLQSHQPAFSPRLFRGLGGGRFEDVTEKAGIGPLGWSGGVTVGDIDNDGDPDLYVTAFGRNTLLRNSGDGTFEDITPRSGAGGSGWSTGATFADLDGDGALDLHVTRYLELLPAMAGAEPCTWRGLSVFCGPIGLTPATHLLFRGNGKGGFQDVSATAGLARRAAPGFMALSLDQDGDGRPDLYVANDTAANFLLRNQGGLRFEDVAILSGCALNGDGLAQASMGVDSADVDGDGIADLFTTHFSHDSNTLWLGRPGGTFRDATASSGLETPSLLTLGWAVSLSDFDLDGDVDLIIVNGHVYPQVDGSDTSTTYRQPLQFFRNEGRGRFRDQSRLVGEDFMRPLTGRGLAVGDIDDDGDLDLLVTQESGPIVLLRCEGVPRAAWIALRLEGTKSNRDAIGARVTVEAGGRVQVREHRLTAGYLSSHDPRLRFGLGDASTAERVRVRWPSGLVETWTGLAVRQVHALKEGTAPAPDAAVTPAGEPAPAPGRSAPQR